MESMEGQKMRDLAIQIIMKLYEPFQMKYPYPLLQSKLFPLLIHYLYFSLNKFNDTCLNYSGGSKDIETYEDIVKFKNATNASSVMVARAAQWNCSVFRKEGKLPLDEVITDYLKYSVDYDNTFTNVKYCIQMMLRDLQETPRGKKVLESKYVDEIWYFIFHLGLLSIIFCH